MSHGHRILLKCARLVHVYLTMFGCLLILFFAVTGFMLNHEDWFLSDSEEETSTSGRRAMAAAAMQGERLRPALQ